MKLNTAGAIVFFVLAIASCSQCALAQQCSNALPVVDSLLAQCGMRSGLLAGGQGLVPSHSGQYDRIARGQEGYAGSMPNPYASVDTVSSVSGEEVQQEQRVERLEQIAFGTTYPEHEVEDRVDHLEAEVFGNKMQAQPIPARISYLESKLGVQSAFGQMGQMPSGVPVDPRRATLGNAMPVQQMSSGEPLQAYPPAGQAAVVASQEASGLNVAIIPMTGYTSGSVKIPNKINIDLSIESVVRAIPERKGAGDYYASINKFEKGATAQWTKFPVRIHLPQGSPKNWLDVLELAVSKWNRYMPVRSVRADEPAEIELAWINQLPPKQLGLTILEVFNGKMRVTIYLLRPTYYLPTNLNKVLEQLALHEIGHGLGLFGHSSNPADVMYPVGNISSKDISRTKYGGISARDLNTLKRVYQAPNLSSGYQTPHPMGWSFKLIP